MASPTATKRENGEKAEMTKVTPISGHHRGLEGMGEGHVRGQAEEGWCPLLAKEKDYLREIKKVSPKHISFEELQGGMNSADTEITPGNISSSTIATAKLAIRTAVDSITIRSMSQPKFSF